MNLSLAYTDRSPTITDVRYLIYRASSDDYFKTLTGITSLKQKSLKIFRKHLQEKYVCKFILKKTLCYQNIKIFAFRSPEYKSRNISELQAYRSDGLASIDDSADLTSPLIIVWLPCEI